jgi:hypothetical protein
LICKGKRTYSNGIVYDGDFESGLMHGKEGKLVEPDGSAFEGSFRSGDMRCGELLEPVRAAACDGESKEADVDTQRTSSTSHATRLLELLAKRLRKGLPVEGP